MEIQSLDLNRAKWVLEPELLTLELHVHFYNCVTHGWFCVASENMTLYLTGKNKKRKEKEKIPLWAVKVLFLKLCISSYKIDLKSAVHVLDKNITKLINVLSFPTLLLSSNG